MRSRTWSKKAPSRGQSSPYGLWVLSIRTTLGAIPFPSPEEAEDHPWTEEERTLVADRVSTRFVGSPETVADKLCTLQRATGADELMITTTAHDHEDRARSYELLAGAWTKDAVR